MTETATLITEAIEKTKAIRKARTAILRDPGAKRLLESARASGGRAAYNEQLEKLERGME